MPKFPSKQWFDATAKVFNNDPNYRSGGSGICNCVMGVQVGKEAFLVTFEGVQCLGGEPAVGDLSAADFCLEMPPGDWRAMLKDIADNGHATLNFTLNTLDLERDDGLSSSVHGDQYREDLFFRYNQTLQDYFDASSQVKTSF